MMLYKDRFVFTLIKRIRSLLVAGALFMTLGTSLLVQALPEPTPNKLPRWSGFNLLEKKDRDVPAYNRPYYEDDFRMISEWGFNFVRLPLDYRIWIKKNNWDEINELALKDIDQAIAWGRCYGIHVCLNFHRAPGYFVNEQTALPSLWSDAEAQRVCAKHWAFFAKRYKGIPNKELSFNLINEPPSIAPALYVNVIQKLVDAIRTEDPERLIIADGLNWSTVPVPELKKLHVAEATRGYEPFYVSHYRASWINASEKWPLPIWPTFRINSFLYGNYQPASVSPLILRGPFLAGSRIRIHVNDVSTMAQFLIKADNKIIFEKKFTTGPGRGEWKTSMFIAQYKNYQNYFGKDYNVTLSSPAGQIEIMIGEGNWLSFSEIGIQLPSMKEEFVLSAFGNEFGVKQSIIELNSHAIPIGTSQKFYSKKWLQTEIMAPWKKCEAEGVGIMIGEFGAYKYTPHTVLLRWMQDVLENWNEAGWGWALWNFRGEFGVLDSGRTDVAYENFRGHKLDRKMLQLLQQHQAQPEKITP